MNLKLIFAMALVVLPLPVVASALLITVIQSLPPILEKDIALAIYNAELEAIVLFAALTPIFVAFVDYYKRPATKKELGAGAVAWILMILGTSAAGIWWNLFWMAAMRFDTGTVFFCMWFIMMELIFLAFFLLLLPGWAQRATKWVYKRIWKKRM